MRWYKHLGRDMLANRRLAPAQWVAVYEDCIRCLELMDREPRTPPLRRS